MATLTRGKEWKTASRATRAIGQVLKGTIKVCYGRKHRKKDQSKRRIVFLRKPPKEMQKGESDEKRTETERETSSRKQEKRWARSENGDRRRSREAKRGMGTETGPRRQ